RSRDPQPARVGGAQPDPATGDCDLPHRSPHRRAAGADGRRARRRRGGHTGGPAPLGRDVAVGGCRDTMLDFASVIPMVTFYVPTYTKRLFEEVDYAPTYAYLTMFLQLLQSRCPG